jgi:hypothetical protein
MLAAPIERYMPLKNEWEILKISQAPMLAAFSWCPLDEGSIVVLGGSDGSLLNSDMYVIDFKQERVMVQHTDFEFSTGMGHLFYRPKEEILHHVGGFNSDGVNFWLKMGEKQWHESERSHMHVIDQNSPELTNNTSVFFK